MFVEAEEKVQKEIKFPACPFFVKKISDESIMLITMNPDITKDYLLVNLEDYNRVPTGITSDQITDRYEIVDEKVTLKNEY